VAQRCVICGKGPQYGHSVSHSDRKTKRRFMPNLQRVRIMYQGRPRRVRVCTTCLKTGRVQRVV